MSGQSPVERAAKVLSVRHDYMEVDTSEVRAVFESIDADGLAAVIADHQEVYDSDCGMYYGCACCWNNGTDEHNDGYAEHVARALVEHLTKGDENDE